MELLTLCSHALYNEDLLDAKKRLKIIEKEYSSIIVPRVNYLDDDSWDCAKKKFISEIDEFVLKTNKKHEMAGVQPLDIYFMDFFRIYYNALNELTKNISPSWCRSKTEALIRSIRLAFSGFKQVCHSGWGTFPFNNWRIDDFRAFIIGIIRNFENKYEEHLYENKKGWLDAICCFKCRCCNRCVYNDSELWEYTRDRKQYPTCFNCAIKIVNNIIHLQALFRVRRLRQQIACGNN